MALLILLISLHETRYLRSRISIPKTDQLLDLILDEYKIWHPDLFRCYLHISPAAFDTLLSKLQNDEIFHNQSENNQIAVGRQIAVALYRLGHYGNAASMQKVTLWAGMGYGTVDLCTRRVLMAISNPRFRQPLFKWPDCAEKEEAKAWVEAQSCYAWRNGWCMVDGTLVPFASRPKFFGNTWYDRKSNYSTNVQIVNLPNLKIIDYGVGGLGSQHDATAWKKTCIPNEHRMLFEPGEWVWADTAYPLQKWCQSPYKRGLRLRLDDEDDIEVLVLWLVACITLHNFTLEYESGRDLEADEFFQEGVASNREEAEHMDNETIQCQLGLREGREFRENLKESLLATII
ncbi:hypothetical protein Clacol_005825 [Clathrus columnatus]|uniref:DDE Tnp4 domain-containing protein n=1 Tax=Clathrus columnatus TaxID=1419009 RepID=A0AAV5AI19_9AGAM|nr:hypothetical protein Clacol_005825 [Clathrus columnatus]